MAITADTEEAAAEVAEIRPELAVSPDRHPPKPPSELAKTLGHWAFEHRDHFKSTTGSILWRNILKGTAAWVPTAVAFTANRYAFKAWKDAHLSEGILKTLQPLAHMPMVENTSFVVAGFTTYRSFIKFWQRAYDRVFTAKSEEDAIRALQNIPRNIGKDAHDIIPHEFSSTLLAAPVLAGIRLGLNPSPVKILDNNPQAAVAGYMQDVLAATVAYSAFFETNDRAYANISGGKDAVDKKYDPHKKRGPKEHKHYAFFTDDGAGRIIFRRVGSVLAGFIPYLAVQRYSRVHVGDVKPFEFGYNQPFKGVMRNLGREYANHVGFSIYTAESELYGKKYDELFARLEEKHKHREHVR